MGLTMLPGVELLYFTAKYLTSICRRGNNNSKKEGEGTKPSIK